MAEAMLTVDVALQDHIDPALQVPPKDCAFTNLTLTTAVLAAKVAGPRHSHRALIAKLIQEGLSGPVKAVNSNYGGTSQPGYEHYIKAGAKEMPLPPAGHKNRQPEGQGGSFNSALEPVMKPSPESEIGQRLAEAGQQDRVYKVKFFPTTGSMQVSGVVLPDLSDGKWVIHALIQFLNDSNLLGGAASLESAIREELVNFKFTLRQRTVRQVINFRGLHTFLTTDPAAGGLPAPLILATLKPPSDGAKASFSCRFGCKTPRVNLFLISGKINFLGFPSYDFAREMYQFLSDQFLANWDKFVALQPLKDGDVLAQNCELVQALNIRCDETFKAQSAPDTSSAMEAQVSRYAEWLLSGNNSSSFDGGDESAHTDETVPGVGAAFDALEMDDYFAQYM